MLVPQEESMPLASAMGEEAQACLQHAMAQASHSENAVTLGGSLLP